MKNSALGFTLVELLVVIAVMAIVGIFTLANYRSFGEDQNLKSAVLDTQSLLRQAQTSATTNVACNNQYDGVNWCVEFAGDRKTVNLKCVASSAACSTSTNVVKSVRLGTDNYLNIGIDSVSGVGADCAAGLSFPFTVNFFLSSGRINFGVADCTLLAISFRNSQTDSSQDLTIEQGGRIYGSTP